MNTYDAIRGIFLAAAIIVGALVVNSAGVLAGEVEAEVIGANFTSFESGLDYETYDAEFVEAHVIEAALIWQDTEAGGYCEIFASVNYAIIDIIGNFIEAPEEGGEASAFIYVDVANILFDEYEPAQTRCINENE
jgi:hypothetical protein